MKPVTLTAVGRATFSRGSATTPSMAARVFSSTGAATMIDFELSAGFQNGNGSEFYNIMFVISPTTTLVFNADAMNHVHIGNCGFAHDYDNTTQAAFRVIDSHITDHGDDASWWRVTDNYVRGGQLLSARGKPENVNRWVVRDNIVFPVNDTRAMIHFKGAHACMVRDNNLEGPTAAAGIHLENSRSCRLDGNAGESTSPFILVDNSHANLISDMGISKGDLKILVRFTNGSIDNLVLASVATGLSDLPYDHTDWIDDQTVDKLNWVIAPSGNSGAADRMRLRTIGVRDGTFPPAATAGAARLYVDSADGDLKVKFSDGVVKTIATDT